jgi:cyclic pyranopterin phosphate synthase
VTAPVRDDVLSFLEIATVVRSIKKCHGLAQVRLTGGEPLLRPGISRLVAMIAAEGVSDLALTTNGQQLAGMAVRLRKAGLLRINVSLDTLNPTTFAEITRGGNLDKTIAGIDAARAAGLRPIKLNAVLVRGQNDTEVSALVRFAIDRECEVRFLELMPIGVAADRFDERFVSSTEVRNRLSQEFELTGTPTDPHCTSRGYAARDRLGRSASIGFISPFSEPFCQGCWRLRLTATGTLTGCLARPGGVPIAQLLRGSSEVEGAAMSTAVEDALAMKRSDGEFIQPRLMVGIGG